MLRSVAHHLRLGGLPCGSTRSFGVKRVRQRLRSRGKILQLKQTHYEPKPEGYVPLPLSLMSSGPIRRMVRSETHEGNQLLDHVDWSAYLCDVPGVRWHPCGGWRVQFHRCSWEHDYYVRCSCFFSNRPLWIS
mmetsp:Transcript_78894/g.210736  ORF Transcript_78894/g.210736 Transcript_78894/m.210736 type:complete len:133 (+) Transcript_78894:1603-2001(+)